MSGLDILTVVQVAFATSAASVTMSKTHITDAPRKWLWTKPRLKELAYLADCPYCVSHWVALVLLIALSPWHGIFVFLVQLGAVIALAAIITGVIMRLLGWDQREVDRLHDELETVEYKLKEATDLIAELLKEIHD